MKQTVGKVENGKWMMGRGRHVGKGGQVGKGNRREMLANRRK